MRLIVLVSLILTVVIFFTVLTHLNTTKETYENLELGDVGTYYGFVASSHAELGFWVKYKSKCVYILRIAVGPNNDNYAVRELEIKLLTVSPFYHIAFIYSDSYKNLFNVIQKDQKTLIISINHPMKGVLYTFKVVLYDERCSLLENSIPILIRVESESGNNIVIAGGIFRINPSGNLLTSEE